MKALKVGDPMGDANIGPRVSGLEVDKLKAMVGQAVSDGAETLLDMAPARGRARARPLVLSDRLLRGVERRGDHAPGDVRRPVIAAMPVDDFDRALAHANDSEYGLSAYVFTRDHRCRIMRCVNELNSARSISTAPRARARTAHHVGYGKSGIGGEDGKHGIEGFLRKKTLYNSFARLSLYPPPRGGAARSLGLKDLDDAGRSPDGLDMREAAPVAVDVEMLEHQRHLAPELRDLRHIGRVSRLPSPGTTSSRWNEIRPGPPCITISLAWTGDDPGAEQGEGVADHPPRVEIEPGRDDHVGGVDMGAELRPVDRLQQLQVVLGRDR